MVDFDKLKTDKERRFVIRYGEQNCFMRTVVDIYAIYEIMMASSFLYKDEDGFLDEDFIKEAKKYAGKEVLIVHEDRPNLGWNTNEICGSDATSPFIDEMFTTNNFNELPL